MKLPLLFLSLVLLSCNLINPVDSFELEQPINFDEISQDRSLLQGEWIWVKDTYYFTSDGKPFVRTPKSSDRTGRLVFEASTVSIFENDEFVRSVSLDDYLNSTFWGVDGEIFAISWAASDGPERVFRRSVD